MSDHLRISVNLEETQEPPEDQYQTVVILDEDETPEQSCGKNGRVLQTATITIEGYDEEYDAIMQLEKICNKPFRGLMELLLLRGFEQGVKYAKKKKP